MTSDGPKIVIEGMRGDWPGGTRTLTSCDARLEPNGQSFWFGVDLNPDGNQVWFRITSGAVGRMREKTPGARGDRLISTLLAWMKPSAVGTGYQPLPGPSRG